LLLIAALAALPTTYASAESVLAFYSGSKLVEQMRGWERVDRGKSLEADDNLRFMNYLGYVTGVADALSASSLICVGSQSTPGQLTAAVANYLNANPESWDDSAVALVARALLGAFPCETAPAKP
jgi:hypothetical protein